MVLCRCTCTMELLCGLTGVLVEALFGVVPSEQDWTSREFVSSNPKRNKYSNWLHTCANAKMRKKDGPNKTKKERFGGYDDKCTTGMQKRKWNMQRREDCRSGRKLKRHKIVKKEK